MLAVCVLSSHEARIAHFPTAMIAADVYTQLEILQIQDFVEGRE